MTMSSIDRRHQKYEPLFDIHPVTGASIEVFWADTTLETFGRRGAGWFWWPRRRGFAPDGAARGPFPTSYSAYRQALERCTIAHNPGEVSRRLRLGADHAGASMRQGAAEQIASKPARAAARALENPLQNREMDQALAPTIGGESGFELVIRSSRSRPRITRHGEPFVAWLRVSQKRQIRPGG